MKFFDLPAFFVIDILISAKNVDWAIKLCPQV